MRFPDGSRYRPMRRGAGRLRGWGRLAAAVFVSALLFAWLIFYVVDTDELRQALARIGPRGLVQPVLIASATLVLAAQRWRTLLLGLGYSVRFQRCLFAVLATWPIAAITPSRAGDGLRAAVIRDEVPAAAGLGSVLIEKLLDVHSLLLLVGAGALASGNGTVGVLASIGVIAFWSSLALVPRLLRHWRGRGISTRLEARLAAVELGLDRLLRSRRELAWATVLSLVASGCSLWIIADLLRSAGQAIPLGDLLLAWPVAVLAAVAPFAFSGLGTRDLAFLALLAVLRPDVERSAVLAATLLFPAVTSWTFALLGAPFLMRALASDPSLANLTRSAPPPTANAEAPPRE